MLDHGDKVRKLDFSKKLFGIADGIEGGLAQGIQAGDFRLLHDGLAQGADKHELGGGKLRVLADPFVESFRNQAFPRWQRGNLKDVPEEIHERGLGLIVGLPELFLGDEEIGTFQGSGDGIEIVGVEFLAALQPLKGGIVTGEVPDKGFNPATVGLSKSSLAGWAEDDPVALLDLVRQ